MGFLSKSQSMGVAAIILAISTMLSRFMGLFRDKVISWQFGAGGESDMYFAAFVVPDIINYLLAGGFLSITLIPLLSKRFEEDERDCWRFFSCVVTWMGVAAIAFTALGAFCASSLAPFVAPGIGEERMGRLAMFMRIVLPAQIFFLTGSCFISLLYLRRQFTIPALSPLIYNGCIIAAGLLLPAMGLVHGMTGYCVGVVIGAGLGTFLLPLLVVSKGGFSYTFTLTHPLMRRFLFLALPLMLGQTVASLDEQFLRVFGSMAGDGAVSLLNYAKRVTQVPVALVAQATATASYPFLVSLLTKGDRNGFSETMGGAIRSGMGLIVPIALWMTFLSESTFTLLFYGGRMTGQEMLAATPLLQILLAATPCWMVYAVLVRGYYAQADTLTPAVAGTIVTAVFVPIYWFVAVPRGAMGIAITSSCAMLVFVLVLIGIWLKRHGTQVLKGLGRTMVSSFLCALPGCAGGWWVDRLVRANLEASPILSSFVGLALAGLVFLVCFLPLSARFCPGALEPLFAKIRSRLHRRR